MYIVTKKLKDGSKRYHVRWGNGRGVPVVHLGAYPKKDLAEDRKKYAEAQLVMDRAPSRELLDEKKRADVGTFKSVAEAWYGSLHLAPSTMKSYRTHVNGFTREFGTMQPRQLTRPVIQAWIDRAHRKEGMMGSTIGLHLNTLRMILRVGAGIDPRTVMLDLSVPKDKYVPLDLPNAKRRAARELLREGGKKPPLSPRRRAIFDVIEHSGMRISEVMELTWGQVDNAGDQLVNIGVKGISASSKKRPRTIKRFDFQPAWIPQRPEGVADSDRVWPEEQIEGRGWRIALGNACEEAKVTPFNPHDLRHLHAVRLNRWLAEGKHTLDHRGMAQRMGHSQQEFLNRYSDHDAPID